MIAFPPSYRPQLFFSEPARARPQIWRTLLGIGLIVLLYAAFLAALFFLLRLRYGVVLAEAIRFAMLRGESPGMAVMLLCSFLGAGLGPIAAVRLIHGRRAGSLFGPPRRLLGDMRAAATGVMALSAPFLAIALTDDSLQRGLGTGDFLVYLPFALLGLLIQTGAEELIFRAYLQQQLAARFRSPLVWMFVPALLFTLGHYAPATYGASAPYVLIWALLFGLLAADLTARTGTIGAAWGFHFANNATAFLFIGSGKNLGGLSLWIQPVGLAQAADPLPAILVQCAMLTCSWLAARIALRR